MTIEQEIEEALRGKVSALFLVGLLTLAARKGSDEMIDKINIAAEKVYLEAGGKRDVS